VSSTIDVSSTIEVDGEEKEGEQKNVIKWMMNGKIKIFELIIVIIWIIKIEFLSPYFIYLIIFIITFIDF
jgi:hypothetical protein